MIIKRIRASSPKYKAIEEVVNVLQANGFALRAIQPKSEPETYTERFDNYSFLSFEAFLKNIYDAFYEYVEKARGCANWDWSSTSFELYNSEFDMRILISIAEENGNTDPRESNFIILKNESKKEEDEMVCNKLLLLLDAYFVKN